MQLGLSYLKLYVPLAVVAGLVVALPTLAAESGAGRAAGVFGGVAGLALFGWWVARRARPSVADVHRRSLTVQTGVALRTESAGDDGAAAADMMRRFARLAWLARLWPALTLAGLLLGALLGVWADSFPLTLLFASTGFLLASLVPAALALRGMRQLTAAIPPRE